MTDISAHLGDGDLSVAEVARRHRVTSRYLHKRQERTPYLLVVRARPARLDHDSSGETSARLRQSLRAFVIAIGGPW
jgi:hypothetical protein